MSTDCLLNGDEYITLGIQVRNMKMVFKFYGTWRWVTVEKLMMKRGTELFPSQLFAKSKFYIIRDTSKSLKHDATTIIISNFH